MRGARWCLLVVVAVSAFGDVVSVSPRLPRTSAVQLAAAAAAQNKTSSQLRNANKTTTSTSTTAKPPSSARTR